jgi:hypothetical protein
MMTRRSRAVTTALVLAFTAAIGATSAPLAAQQRTLSADSTISVVLPADFIPVRINDSAALQFADSVGSVFVMILRESKHELAGWNLARHSMVTLGRAIAGMEMPELAGPVHASLAGHPAVHYELRGTTNGVAIAALHSTIETPSALAQVFMWTAPEQWVAREPMLRQVLASVEFIDAPASLSRDVFDIVPGTWAWPSQGGCTGATQTFAVAPDRRSMTITHSEPYEAADGTMKSVTHYVIEDWSDGVLHTFIVDESRVTDDGAHVKWDLVLVGRNRLAWHRTDWDYAGLTAAMHSCTQPTS